MYKAGFHIPVPGPIKDVFGWVSDKLNPFVYLAQALENLYMWMVGFFENVLARPPRPGEGEWVISLDNRALTYASIISVMVLVVKICQIMFSKKHSGDLFQAFVIAVAIGASGALWFVFAGKMIDFGHQLSAQMIFYHPQGDDNTILGIGSISNAVAAIIGYASLLFPATLLMIVVIFYQVVNIFLTAFGIVCVSSRAVGPRAQHLSDFTIALGIVTMLLGPAVAILCIEIGKAFGDTVAHSFPTIAGGGAFIRVICINGGLWFALAMQPTLLILMMVYTSRVMGHVNSFSQIIGRVVTEPQKHKVDVNMFNAGHSGAVPVRVVEEPAKKQSAAGAAAVEARHHALEAATVVTIAAVTGGVGASAVIGGKVAAGASKGAANKSKRGGGKK